MILRMNWQDATFKATDVIKLVTFFVLGAFAWTTLKTDVSQTRESVTDIRATQVENTKKNDLRWETISLEINAIKINQSVLEQRIKALEDKKK